MQVAAVVAAAVVRADLAAVEAAAVVAAAVVEAAVEAAVAAPAVAAPEAAALAAVVASEAAAAWAPAIPQDLQQPPMAIKAFGVWAANEKSDQPITDAQPVRPAFRARALEQSTIHRPAAKVFGAQDSN